MTATILLIRHAAHDHVGRILTGRLPHVPLSAGGRDEAAAVARHLAAEPIAVVQASPSLRAQQTASAIAAPHDLHTDVVEPMNEIDFGEWEGRTFAELESDPRWHDWNTRRATTAPPGGEAMTTAQARAWSHLLGLARGLESGMAAVVTHCDIIRAVIARALNLSLDNILRFDIPPASVSRIVLGEWGAQVVSLNERAA